MTAALLRAGPLPDGAPGPVIAPEALAAEPAVPLIRPAPIFIYDTHDQADQAIRQLHRHGFDVRKLSLIGKGFHSEELPMGFYTAGDRIRAWGGRGAFWGSVWGLLVGPGIFMLPGVGLVALAGPLVATLVAALEGAVVVGGVSALAAALSGMGMPQNEVVRYESALKADKYVLMVHGSADDAIRVHAALARSDAGADIDTDPGAAGWKAA